MNWSFRFWKKVHKYIHTFPYSSGNIFSNVPLMLCGQPVWLLPCCISDICICSSIVFLRASFPLCFCLTDSLLNKKGVGNKGSLFLGPLALILYRRTYASKAKLWVPLLLPPCSGTWAFSSPAATCEPSLFFIFLRKLHWSLPSLLHNVLLSCWQWLSPWRLADSPFIAASRICSISLSKWFHSEVIFAAGNLNRLLSDFIEQERLVGNTWRFLALWGNSSPCIFCVLPGCTTVCCASPFSLQTSSCFLIFSFWYFLLGSRGFNVGSYY